MRLFFLMAAATLLPAQSPYTLLIKGGHVIDPKSGRSAKLDVAIQGRRIAKVAAAIQASQATRVANADGLYVVPGLIDIHAHVYTGTGVKALTGDSSVYPDGFSFRSGVTTLGSGGMKRYLTVSTRAPRNVPRRCSSRSRRISSGSVAMLVVVVTPYNAYWRS